MLLFSIAVIIALCGAKKQIRLQLQRAEGPYMNSVISAQEHEQHNRFNPSSSKFDIRLMNIPKTVNVMDVDAKSMRSLHDNEHYKALKARMMRINLLMIFNILTFVMLIAGGWYIYQKELYRIMSNQTFPPLTTSPMATIDAYVARAGATIMYIVTLLWWQYIPKSLCCDNIARDSLFFACCRSTLSCCDVLQPSNRVHNVRHDDEENSTDFDFFNLHTWRSDLRIATYRNMEVDPGNGRDDEEVKRPLHDPDTSVTFDSAGDKDYNDIVTLRSTGLPVLAKGSDDILQKSNSRQFEKVDDESTGSMDRPPSGKKAKMSAVFNTVLS